MATSVSAQAESCFQLNRHGGYGARTIHVSMTDDAAVLKMAHQTQWDSKGIPVTITSHLVKSCFDPSQPNEATFCSRTKSLRMMSVTLKATARFSVKINLKKMTAESETVFRDYRSIRAEYDVVATQCE